MFREALKERARDPLALKDVMDAINEMREAIAKKRMEFEERTE